MRTWMIRLLLPAVVLAAPALGQQQPGRMRVNADNVNLRVAPSIDSTIVRALAKGTLVTILARDGNWVKVQTASVTGWVRGSQLMSITDVAKDTAAQSQSAAPAPRSASGVPSVPAPAAVPPSAPRQPIPIARQSPAQTPAGPSLALLGGITASSGSFAPSSAGDVFSTRRGFTGGLGVEVPLAGPIGIAFEPAFVQKGLGVANAGATLALSTAYIELPVQLRITIGSRRGGVYLSAGGEAGYELTCQVTRTSAASTPCDHDAAFTNRQKMDFGVVGGAGLLFGSFVIGARYEMGMRDLYTDSGEAGRNRSLLVYTGIRF